MFNAIFGENVGFVAKVNVTDLDRSRAWYVDKLELVPDPRFDTDNWTQLNIPGVPLVAIGLYADNRTPGTAGGVSTFVVEDIEATRDDLRNRGVDVHPIEKEPGGVSLAFFDDPDGNHLGLRQNSPEHPPPNEIGAL